MENDDNVQVIERYSVKNISGIMKCVDIYIKGKKAKSFGMFPDDEKNLTLEEYNSPRIQKMIRKKVLKGIVKRQKCKITKK